MSHDIDFFGKRTKTMGDTPIWESLRLFSSVIEMVRLINPMRISMKLCENSHEKPKQLHKLESLTWKTNNV